MAKTDARLLYRCGNFTGVETGGALRSNSPIDASTSLPDQYLVGKFRIVALKAAEEVDTLPPCPACVVIRRRAGWFLCWHRASSICRPTLWSTQRTRPHLRIPGCYLRSLRLGSTRITIWRWCMSRTTAAGCAAAAPTISWQRRTGDGCQIATSEADRPAFGSHRGARLALGLVQRRETRQLGRDQAVLNPRQAHRAVSTSPSRLSSYSHGHRQSLRGPSHATTSPASNRHS
jgi:hypothetical protein